MTQTKQIMVDSSILNAYKEGDIRARELIRNAIDRNINISICTVSIINIWSMTKFDRKSEIGFTGIFSFLDVIDLDNDVAQHAGSLLRENLDMDSSLGIERAVVAAYAGLAGKNIVTNYPEGYSQFNCDTKYLQSYIVGQT
tara:strand:+ start:929 stop:1351 length:423 start_codon:yes stop_codon:yes gene_type:complete